ncbi:MAG: flippase [Candidatus Omnitrophota bacterium]
MEKLSRNMIWMGAANCVSSLFGAIMLIYLARTLMPAALGNLSYAISIIVFLASFLDLGLSTYGIREVAKAGGSDVSEYVSNIVSLRFVIAVILTVIVAAVSMISRQPGILKLLMIETCLMMFMAAFATEWAFQGLEKMYMVFASFLVTSLLQLTLMLVFVRHPEDVVKVPFFYFLGSIPVIATFLKLLKFRFKVRKPDTAKLKLYLTSSLVIWAIAMFAQVYNNLDIFLLGLFRKAEEVGYFTVARRAVGGVTILAVFLANALLPRLSCTFNIDAKQFKGATIKFLAVTTVIIILILLPVLFFAKDLLRLTVGAEYVPAAIPLNIMIGALILVLFNLPFSTGLIAACLEKEVLKQVIASAFFSVALNLVLIPKYGMVGAAVSFFCAEALALIWILYVYKVKIAGSGLASGR